jgi:hypothetical protein
MDSRRAARELDGATVQQLVRLVLLRREMAPINLISRFQIPDTHDQRVDRALKRIDEHA